MKYLLIIPKTICNKSSSSTVKSRSLNKKYFHEVSNVLCLNTPEFHEISVVECKNFKIAVIAEKKNEQLPK